MKIIDTGITNEILSGKNRPQLKIADKLYTVDDRQSTFDKIQKVQNEQISDSERTKKIFELALGTEAAKEIIGLDMPFENMEHLTFCLMGAITGEDPKKLRERAEKQIEKNL